MTAEGIQGTVALIPARAGSKGLPGKNLRVVAGRSLLAHACAVAAEVEEIDRVVVSTDGDDIAAEAERCGAEVICRPDEFATDGAVVADTIRHALGELRASGQPPRYGVLLEPTTPMREAEDVRRCIRALETGADSAATFTEAALHPHRAFVIGDDGVAPFVPGAVPWRPRQGLQPPAYQLSGACYAFDCERFPDDGPAVLFGRIAAVVVPRERSLDIDDEVDLLAVEARLTRR